MKAISVSQLNSYIKNIFDAEELLHHISVVGEVFGVSFSRNVAYFSLKDENATLPCVCFYPNFFHLLEEGASIVVTGSPNFYVKGGKLNFNISNVETLGVGKLYEEFIKLKEKLEKEGLFSGQHKKEIPKIIKRIGVITSKEGAVLQDIKNIAWRRNPSVDLVLFSTKVQGKDAEKEIAHAIERMGNYENIDVIIVARGGGSLEDLNAYNTEIVARATFNCPKPIVSAIGHETDFTIIDFVSDLRAPTPSAAAELLTYNIQEKRQDLLNLMARFVSASNNFYKLKFQEVFELQNSLKSNIESIYIKEKTLTEKRLSKFIYQAQNFVQEKVYYLGLCENSLTKLNPLAILKQGYARIEQNGKALNSKNQIMFDNKIEIFFKDGWVNALPQKEEK